MCYRFFYYSYHIYLSTDALEGTMTTTDALCYGSSIGTAYIDVVGGVLPYTYSWTPNSGAEDGGLYAGEYSITVVDNNNCIMMQKFNISEPSMLCSICFLFSSYSAGSFSFCLKK